MTANHKLIATLAVLALVPSRPSAAQTDVPGRIATAQKELIIGSREDSERQRRPGYLAGRIGQLRDLIRDEILRQLNGGQWKDSTLLQNLAPALTKEWNGPLSLIHKQLNGADLVIIGYSIRHGPSAIPDSTVVIEAFRKVADRYELVDQTGEGLANSVPKLEQLSGPWTNEIWILAHGQQTGVMQYHERVRIYSFDGQRFKELWGHEPLRQATFEAEKGQVKVMFETEEDLQEMVLTLALLPQGPMQISLLPKQ
jgi:hypothetical protein